MLIALGLLLAATLFLMIPLLALVPLLLLQSKIRYIFPCIVFSPGATMALLTISFFATIDGDPITRLTFWWAATDTYAAIPFWMYWVVTTLCVLPWFLFEGIRRCAPTRGHCAAFPWRPVLASLLVALVISGAAGLYLTNYMTLEDAVREGDVALAKKRLRFNLLGVDANNGYIYHYTGGTEGETLLTLAVSSNNLEMAELLLDSGADPNKDGGAFGGGTARDRTVPR